MNTHAEILAAAQELTPTFDRLRASLNSAEADTSFSITVVCGLDAAYPSGAYFFKGNFLLGNMGHNGTSNVAEYREMLRDYFKVPAFAPIKRLFTDVEGLHQSFQSGLRSLLE